MISDELKEIVDQFNAQGKMIFLDGATEEQQQDILNPDKGRYMMNKEEPSRGSI